MLPASNTNVEERKDYVSPATGCMYFLAKQRTSSIFPYWIEMKVHRPWCNSRPLPHAQLRRLSLYGGACAIPRSSTGSTSRTLRNATAGAPGAGGTVSLLHSHCMVTLGATRPWPITTWAGAQAYCQRDLHLRLCFLNNTLYIETTTPGQPLNGGR